MCAVVKTGTLEIQFEVGGRLEQTRSSFLARLRLLRLFLRLAIYMLSLQSQQQASSESTLAQLRSVSTKTRSVEQNSLPQRAEKAGLAAAGVHQTRDSS